MIPLPEREEYTLFTMSRFVLLRHDCPPDYERPSHWDLMLESGDVLRTWSLAELPRAWQADRSQSATSSDTIDAEELADHRLAYLDYEGPVGGERGAVRRVDASTFETETESADCWEVTLHGSVLRGRLTLRRSAADVHRWTLAVAPRD
jgi:hypothetical protein